MARSAVERRVKAMSVALAALALLAAQSAAQTPPPDAPPPYTLAGVRRAAAAADRPPPGGDPATEGAEQPTRPLWRSANQQKIAVATWAPEVTYRPPLDDRPVTPSLAPVGNYWHQEFLSTTTPDEVRAPFGMMGGADVAAISSSVAFAFAFDQAVRLVQHLRKAHRQGKVDKLRRQIDEETALVEKLYRERLAEAEKKK
jgi:hypothetical protein